MNDVDNSEYAGYAEFQEKLMEAETATLLIEDRNGNVVVFQIEDTWATAFPPILYANCAAITILDPVHGNLNLQGISTGHALYGTYTGSGTFRSQIKVISADNGFCVQAETQH